MTKQTPFDKLSKGCMDYCVLRFVADFCKEHAKFVDKSELTSVVISMLAVLHYDLDFDKDEWQVIKNEIDESIAYIDKSKRVFTE